MSVAVKFPVNRNQVAAAVPISGRVMVLSADSRLVRRLIGSSRTMPGWATAAGLAVAIR